MFLLKGCSFPSYITAKEKGQSFHASHFVEHNRLYLFQRQQHQNIAFQDRRKGHVMFVQLKATESHQWKIAPGIPMQLVLVVDVEPTKQ